MTHKNEAEVRKGRHCVSALHAHLIFVTKYRRKVFNDVILNRLEAILLGAVDLCSTYINQPTLVATS
ncbi:transposase [Pseudoalteromonas sp. HL-AS2]|uniref:transposase n=1 Tax=Pseudoalteromonas sp. HL-AS2 TaxID=3071082 RepID=UPI0035C1073E